MNTNNILYRIYSRLVVIALIILLSSSDNLFSQTWQQTNGPKPTTNEVVSLVTTGKGYVYAGTLGGGIYLTTDKGSSWTAVNNGITSTNVRALAILPSGSVMAGTDEGVFVSDDNGTSWTQLNNGIGNNRINKLVINSKGNIYAGTHGAGLFFSADTGNTWTSLGITGINISALAVDTLGFVFVGTEGLTSGTYGAGIYTNYHNGNSFYPINSGLPSLPIYSITSTPSNDIFAGTYGSGAYYYTHTKNTWTQKDTGLPANANVYSILCNASSYIYAGLGGTSFGAYISTDYGQTWASNSLVTDISVFSLDSTGYLYAGAKTGGVYRTAATTVLSPPVPTLVTPLNLSLDMSTDEGFAWNSSFGAQSYRLQLSTDSTFATTVYDSSRITDTSITFKSLQYATKYFWRVSASNSMLNSNYSDPWKFTTIHAPSWTLMSDSLTNFTVQSLLVSSKDYVFAGTNGNGINRSTNGGISWKEVGLPGTEVYSLTTGSTGYIFAGVGYLSQGAFLSTDNGNTWNPIGLTSSNAVAALVVSSTGFLYAGTYGNVYLSKDKGSTWSTVNNGLPLGPNVVSLAINSSGYVFAGLGYTSSNLGLYLSKDNGTNWSFSGLANCGDIHALSINSAGYIYAGTDKGVFLSTDGGINWTQNGLPGAQVMAFAITSSGSVFAGTYGGGVYLSVDNGTNWTQINDGINSNNINVSSLAINSSGYLFAGTWGNGIYRSKISLFVPQQTPVLISPPDLTADYSITPVLKWSAPAGTSSYRLQVSPDSNFSSAVFDSSGIRDTSYTIYNKLALGTKYFWRVNASNSFGTSSWTNAWRFTTTSNQAIVVTNSATNISQTTATLNGTVNAKGQNTAVWFEYGTTTSYGYTANAVESPLTGNSNASVSAPITNLYIITLYHYRVVAYNNSTGDMVNGPDSTFTTLGTLASAKTTDPVKVNTVRATLTGTVNPNGSTTIVKFQYGTTTSYGKTANAVQGSMSGNADMYVSAPVAGLTPNTLYHYRVMATNSGTSYGSDLTFTTYSTSVSLDHRYTFGDPTQSGSFQMMGVPGNGSIALSSVVSGTPKQDWDAYYDNGNSSNYLVEFDNSAKFTFSPGMGVWVISRNTFSVYQTVSPVALDTGINNSNYAIPLHSGWNIISNPFNNDCKWASVVDVNSLTANAPILYSWSNSNWNQSTVFSPYIGYYIYNVLDLASLIIPYNSTGALGKITAPQKTTAIDSSLIKEMEISLLKNSDKITSVFAAVNPKASGDFDQYDYLAPPADFQNESIAMVNDSLSISYKKLIKDCRPGIGDGKEFNFTVTNKNGAGLKLVFNGLKSFSGYECYLMNCKSKQFYNLNEKNTIDINSLKTSSYKLLVGNDKYIQKMKTLYAPGNYCLYQNYPNPFNPSTTISYNVMAASHVKISIHNALGEMVKELVNNDQDFGFHEVQLDGSRLASGVYFYTIQVNSFDGRQNFKQTKKMVLLK